MRWTPLSGLVLLAGLTGCGEDPDPCAPMCRAATALYGTCLDEWGLDWSSAGYDDAAHFAESCETWAWTSRLLEADAGEDGAVDRVCRTRRARFEAGTCEDLTAVDWNGLPWEPVPDSGGAP